MIGVLGASGAVGRHTVDCLRRIGVTGLRFGGRNIAGIEQLLGAETDDEAIAVDIADPDALAQFCAGCACVVNCAGPAAPVGDRVAAAAAAARAHYIDTHTEQDIALSMTRIGVENPWWAAVIDAGMSPGLTGILPMFLAATGFDRVHAVTGYVGGLDRISLTAAGDYLHSMTVGHGQPRAAWRAGQRRQGVLSPMLDVELPFFPQARPLNAFPYLTAEAERVARRLGARELSCYHVFEGRWGVAAISRLRDTASTPDRRAAAAGELVHANALDNFGRAPYQVLVFRMTGEHAGQHCGRTLVARGGDSCAFSGATAASAAVAVLEGRVPGGVHRALDVMCEAPLIERLGQEPTIHGIEVIDEAVDGAVDEGCL
jgi:hypothetical protein